MIKTENHKKTEELLTLIVNGSTSYVMDIFATMRTLSRLNFFSIVNVK